MIRLNTKKNLGDAYMLRRDGTEIWVDVHPYGVITKHKATRESNLLTAVFLARYSQYNKEAAIKFINSYLAELVLQATEEEEAELTNPNVIRKYLKQKLASMPKTFIQVLEWQGIVGEPDRNAAALVQYYDPAIFSNFDEAWDVDTRDNGIDLAVALNQEFIRIRIGGRYDSYGDRVYYARIGSTGFNWADLIKKSVKSHWKKDNIEQVCIERDSESDTGNPFDKGSIYVYKTDNGEDIANIPVEKYLEEQVSLISSMKYHTNSVEYHIQSMLSRTPAIDTLRTAKLNSSRLFRIISQLCLNERTGLNYYQK